MAKLIYKNIQKVYKSDVFAVKDFNLEINDKEFVVLVGPSGCGKSTVLRMTAGLESITGGEIFIGDKLVNKIEARDRNISMVFQNYALYPHLSAYRNMSFGMEIRKIKKEEVKKRVTEIAEMLGIDHLLERKPDELSGGERQRVAIGRAIVRNPVVFLFDEPLSNLDAKLRANMRKELIKLHKDLSTTFIYVTHDQIEAMTMADKIVIMDKGFIQQIGSPDEIFRNPANIFVAGFIGMPSMNFIRGRVIIDNGVFVLMEDAKIPLNQSLITENVLLKYKNKEVLVGIRPDNINMQISESCGFPYLCNIKIDQVEKTGSEQYIYGMFGKTDITISYKGNHEFISGQSINFSIDVNKIVIFDLDSGKNIGYNK